MSTRRLVVSGVSMNWIAYATTALVMFFLSPFVVHHLGNVAYGVWVLVTSTTAYFALLDMGLRGAVVQFVATQHAKGQDVLAGRAVSAALLLRIAFSGVIILASGLLAISVEKLFKMPAEMRAPARWALLAAGSSVAITLIGGVFSGVLAALQRFDLISSVNILQVLLQMIGTVVLLRRGGGIVSLAVLLLILTVAANLAFLGLCYGVYPRLRVTLAQIDRGVIRQLWSYSSYLFLLSITGQVIYYTDNIIVGALVSAEAVAFYAIGGRLLQYMQQPTAAMAQTFMPLASSLEAQDKHDALRELLIQGTRAALLVSLPIAVVLFFRGGTFIGLWMGKEYAQISGKVLRILLFATFVQVGNHANANIIYGLGKHRIPALWQTAEAVVNLVLCILLAKQWGLYGVAWSVVIPELVVQGVLWPRYVSRLLSVSLGKYLLEAWLRPLVAVVPLAVGCIYAEQHWIPQRLYALIGQILLLLPLYLVGIVACFWRDLTCQLRKRWAVRSVPVKVSAT